MNLAEVATSSRIRAAVRRWSIGPDGELATSDFAIHLMGCTGAPVPGWVFSAARAGMDGDTLVLVARDGAELARMVPAP